MRLSSKLKKYGVPCLHAMPLHANPCIVLGNLYEDVDLQKRLDRFYYLSPLELKDENVEFFGKYEVGSEEGVLALLLEFFAIKKDERLDKFLDDLDIGYISAECNIGEEEVSELALHAKGKKPCLVICGDLEFHENADNIARFLSMLSYYGEFLIVYEFLDEDIKGEGLQTPDEIEELKSFDGAVVYFTNKDGNLLLGSNQFALSNRLKDKDMVSIKIKDDELKREFRIDDELKGTIGLLQHEAKETYAYEVTKISRIENE